MPDNKKKYKRTKSKIKYPKKRFNNSKQKAERKAYDKAVKFQANRLKKLNTPGTQERPSGGPGTMKKKPKNYRQ